MSFVSLARRATRPIVQQEQVITWQLSGTATALGTTARFWMPVSDIVFTTSSLGGETIAITALKGNNQTVTPIVYSKTTGLTVTASALASGTYYIKLWQLGDIASLTFTKSAAVNSGIVSGVAVKQSYNTQG